MTPYEMIEAKSEELGILKHYTNDLYVHDKNALEDYEGPFLWVVRSHGTHLIKVRDPDWKWHSFIPAVKSMHVGSMGSNVRIFRYNPESTVKLAELTEWMSIENFMRVTLKHTS